MNTEAMVEAASAIFNQKRLNNELMQAISLKKASMLRSLIEQGADVNFDCPNTNRTPLTMAINHQFYKGVQILLAKGADVNMTHSERLELTPLNAAVLFGDVEMIKLLLRYKINHSHTSKFKKNTMMYCVDGGLEENLKFLLSLKFYNQIKDEGCKRTLAYAKHTFNTEAMSMIKSHLKLVQSQQENEKLIESSHVSQIIDQNTDSVKTTKRVRL